MILSIDTKDRKIVRVSLRDKIGKVVAEKTEENEYGSQVLLPLIMEILKTHDLTLEDLTEIQVEKGPGSFTGLRVGASVGQALGFALNIPVNGKLNSPVDLVYQ